MMASDKESKMLGTVRTEDLSVSWASESGVSNENTDRVCILTMANGQVRLTMQSATINLKGIRLTKGHVCVFALFEAGGNDKKDVAAADRASEIFMNAIMKYDIIKKPAKDILMKCLSKVSKNMTKEFMGACYKASVAVFAAKDLTACSTNGGRMFILSDDDKVSELRSDGVEILRVGLSWKNIMMVSGGYPTVDDEVKGDMRSPIGDIITKRKMGSLPDSSSIVRAQRL